MVSLGGAPLEAAPGAESVTVDEGGIGVAGGAVRDRFAADAAKFFMEDGGDLSATFLAEVISGRSGRHAGGAIHEVGDG